MNIDLGKVPYFFLGGFSIKPENKNVKMEDVAKLDRFIDDLFNMRLNKNFTILEVPVFVAEKNLLTFSCKFTTPLISDEKPFNVSVDAKFSFTCPDVEVNEFSLECESIKKLTIIDHQDPTSPIETAYENWGCDKFNDSIGGMYNNLAKLLSANPHRMEHQFNNGGLDLFRELENHIEQKRRLESAYSKVTVEVANDDFSVDKDYVVRSVAMKDTGSTDFLKKAYQEIGSDVGLNRAVQAGRNKATTEIEGYLHLELNKNPDVVHHDDFYMSNCDATGFLKIKHVESITLEDLEASRKFFPKILDLDIGKEVGV